MSQTIEPATDQEEQHIRDDIDEIVVCSNPGGGQKTLHISLDGEPACQRNYNANSQMSEGDVTYSEKDVECYPPGFYPFCRFCVDMYREGI